MASGTGTSLLPDVTAIRYEHDTLSRQASQLASTLARRRADLALMRAEEATVALSLESAKHRLDTALRTESDIRAGAPSSPRSYSSTKADFLPDAGLVRALEGQLDVTRGSVFTAKQRRDELQAEVAALQQRISGETADDKNREERVTPALTGPVASSPDINGSSNDGSGSRDGAWPNKRRSVRLTLEQSVLRVLDEGVSSRSSFRFDHAHIWRDVTMPNMVLIEDAENDNDAPSHDYNPATVVGVVTERIFEGVTCFTPTERNADFPEHIDLHVDSSDINSSSNVTFKPDGILRARVVTHFGTLCTSPAGDGRMTRIIAPQVALQRVRKLASDASRRSGIIRQPPSIVNDLLARPLTPPSDTPPEMGPKSPPPPATPFSEKVISSVPSEVTDMNATGDSAIVFDNHPQENLLKIPTPRRSALSSVLSDSQFADLMEHGVPVRFHESMLQLLYSTEVHGMSLRTLYTRARGASPTIIAIRDTRGRVFGCYGAHPWRISATRYYGTGESFVFGTAHEERDTLRLYKWSRTNSLFQFTSGSFLAIGGGAGSHFALWVDEDLFMGTTSSCSTFENPPLTDCGEISDGSSTEFKILTLEVWGFSTDRGS